MDDAVRRTGLLFWEDAFCETDERRGEEFREFAPKQLPARSGLPPGVGLKLVIRGGNHSKPAGEAKKPKDQAGPPGMIAAGDNYKSMDVPAVQFL